MKRNHFRHILLCLCLLAGISASAYVEVGGIYYELGGKEATVTSGSTKYSGLVTIPASFTFKGKTYKVTAIGDNAFYYCYDLTGVTIPKGVKTIGDDAFYNCDGLTAITIPEGVTTIGPYAFDDCDGLTAITIPEGVTTIGTYAFYSCNRLASITFPESMTNIGAWAFYETSWYSNQPNGLIYAGKVAYKYKGTIPEGTEIVIEDGTKGIADTAFGSSWSGSGNSSLTSVVIAETVTNIGEYAFGYCSALSSITIPESVTSIGGYAFAGTAWYTNQPDGMVYAGKVAYQYKGTMPSGTQITLKEGTKGIAGRAFYYSYGGSSLTDIYIPSSVTNIGDYAFYRCDGLTSISIPNSVTSIGKYAFYQCSYLQSILIPASVASIGNGAFRRCNKARSITVSEDNPKYDSRGGSNAIIETATNKLLVGNAYTTIPNTVESIGAEAFFGCSGLYDIAIPGSVTSIGDNAFNECYDLSSVTISNGVTSIGDYAFRSTGLASVTIPASVAYIGTGVFSYCDLVTLKVNGGNPYYDSRDGCNAIIEKATNTLIAGSSSSTVPKGVTAIGDYAFSNCTGLSILDIPEGVTYIGQHAFSGCSRLYSITIPEGVEGINYNTFSECSRLSSITLPGSVTHIESYAFYYCSRLSSINIPEAVSSIGSYAFQGCKALRTITVPDRVKDLYGYTFSGCTNLSKVIIGRDVGYVNGYAFGSCENLTDVYCYALKVPSTNTNAFYNVDLSYARLHVPEALVDAYETSYPWSEFGQIIGIAEGDMEQCAKPTISYASGKLTFDCATEDAGFFYDIWDDDIKSGAGGKVNLSVTYHIGVYAIKTGYKDSEVATGTLCWVDVQPTMEGVGEDAVAEVEAVPVLIQTEGSRITVQGAANGTEVFVYSTDGMQQGSVISAEGIATLNTSLQPGSVAIVRIGERTVKVLMK